VSATQLDSIAKSVNADIQAVQPWCGPTSLTCGAPQGMGLLLGPAKSAQRPSLRVHYAGSSHANVRISKRREQARLDQLLGISPEVQAVYALLQAFVKMVRERTHQDLRSWMKEAIGSGIPELKSFVTGIERDYDAVHAALRLPWSQGTTEGKVNKLKTLKRAMYGRAGFALLRQRLLHDA
jgi:transposase